VDGTENVGVLESSKVNSVSFVRIIFLAYARLDGGRNTEYLRRATRVTLQHVQRISLSISYLTGSLYLFLVTTILFWYDIMVNHYIDDDMTAVRHKGLKAIITRRMLAVGGKGGGDDVGRP